VLLGGYIALKWWERRRFYKMLRIARIGVDELRALMDGGKRPVVVDVRSPSNRDLDRVSFRRAGDGRRRSGLASRGAAIRP